MYRRPVYETKCTVRCTDNMKRYAADVLDFQPKSKLVISIDKKIRMEMRYNPRSTMYICNQSGLEYTSSGPRQLS